MTQPLTPATNYASTILEAGRDLERKPAILSHDRLGDFSVVPTGYALQDLQGYKPGPRRLEQAVTVHTADSFIAYVALFAGANKRPVVFADLKAPQPVVVGVLDYHEGHDAPSWNKHRVTLPIKLSRPFAEWKAKNEQGLDQTAFARFIENHMAQIATPDGATLHEMCLKFEATKAVEFQSHNNVANGSVKFTYNENVQGTVRGGEMKMPTEMTLVMPIVEGGEPQAITARLRYRVEAGGKLVLWFDLVVVDDLVEQHCQAVAEKIGAALDGRIRGVILGTL